MARRLLERGIHGLQRVSQRAVALDVNCEIPCVSGSDRHAVWQVIPVPHTGARAEDEVAGEGPVRRAGRGEGPAHKGRIRRVKLGRGCAVPMCNGMSASGDFE